MSAIKVNCPKCTQQLSATPKAAGSLRLRCPSCGCIFVINVPASKVPNQPVAQTQQPDAIPVIPITRNTPNQNSASFPHPIAQPTSTFLDQLNSTSFGPSSVQGSPSLNYYTKPNSGISGKALLILSGAIGVSMLAIAFFVFVLPFALSLADGDVAYRSQRVDDVENELLRLDKLDLSGRGDAMDLWKQANKKISKSEYDAIVAKYSKRLQQYESVLKRACNLDPQYRPRSNWREQVSVDLGFAREDLSNAAYQYKDPYQLASKLIADIQECRNAIKTCISSVRDSFSNRNDEDVLDKATSILSNIDSARELESAYNQIQSLSQTNGNSNGYRMPSIRFSSSHYFIWEYQRKRLKRLNLDADKVINAVQQISR